MKKIITIALLLAAALPASALEDGQVMYSGGTVQNLKEGTTGSLDTKQELSLTFEHSGGKLSIPYAKIESFEHSEKIAHRLGVVATVAVVLVKHRQRRHYFRISYRDENNSPQVAIFEVPKEMPQTLLAVLQARAPHACKSPGQSRCGQSY